MRRDVATVAGPLTAAAALLLAACSGSSSVELPAAVRERAAFMAAVALDGAGNPIAFSGIDATDGHVELAPDGDVAAIDVIGWAAADLPGMNGADREHARDTPLAIATRCDAALPAPRLAERIQGDGPAVAGTFTVVSAAVPSAACLPGWTRHLTVEARCVTQVCLAAITAENGCSAEVELTQCHLDTYRVQATNGPPCAERHGDVCSSSALDTGGTELSCPGPLDCDIRFYTTQDDGWATVTRTPILDVPARQPSDILTFALRSTHRFSGYLGPLFILGDRVGVVSHQGRYNERQHCGSSEPSEIRWLDRNALYVSTATVPACLRPIVPLPDGERAIAGWLEGTEVWVGEVAPGTGVVRRKKVALDAAIEPSFLSEGIVGPDGVSVLMGLATDNVMPGESYGQILVIDPRTLDARSVTVPDAAVMALALDRHDVVFGGDGEDVIGWVDLQSGALVDSDLVPSSGSKSIGDVEVDPGTDRVWLAMPNEEPVIHTYFRRQVKARARVFDDVWRPTTLVRAGSGAGRIFVASARLERTDNTYQAGLSRAAMEADGVLPGVVILGFGLVGEHARDRDGVLWATLPWSAEIVRVRLSE